MTITAQSAWGGQVLPLLSQGVQVENLGNGFYKLDFPRITQTGAKVSIYYAVPFPHKFISLFLKHVDINLADSIDAFTFALKKELRDNLFFTLISFAASVAADELSLWGMNSEVHSACQYLFETNTTATDFIYPSMIIQRIGEL